MKKTWILVAHRAGARVFEHDSPKSELKTIKEFDNPAGKLANHEIKSDKYGEAFAGGSSNAHHSLASEQNPREHVLEKFAKELVRYLDDEGDRGHFEQLILVAEPRTLGSITSSLNAKNQKRVAGSLIKDLSYAGAAEIKERVEKEFGSGLWGK